MSTIEPKSAIIESINFGEPTNNNPLSVENFYMAGDKKTDRYDYSYLSDTQGINKLQTIFIDNYENDKDLIFTNLNNGQKIVCKANKQGYFPLLATNKLKFSIYSETELNIKINFYLVNFIIAQGAW